MRAHLAMLCAVAAAFALAIFGPLAFSVSQEHPAAAPARPAAAQPGLVWRSGGMALLLTDRPCPFEEIAAELEAEGIPPARAYAAQQGERRSTGCWVRNLDGDAVTRRPDGELGTIPKEWFRHEPIT